MRRAQKVLARKQKGGEGRDKAGHKLAGVHQNVRNQGQDFWRELATALVEDYDGFCIEDVSLKGRAQPKLVKRVFDAGLGEFRRQLGCKVVWRPNHLAVVDRWFKLCPACGAAYDRDVTLPRASEPRV